MSSLPIGLPSAAPATGEPAAPRDAAPVLALVFARALSEARAAGMPQVSVATAATVGAAVVPIDVSETAAGDDAPLPEAGSAAVAAALALPPVPVRPQAAPLPLLPVQLPAESEGAPGDANPSLASTLQGRRFSTPPPRIPVSHLAPLKTPPMPAPMPTPATPPGGAVVEPAVPAPVAVQVDAPAASVTRAVEAVHDAAPLAPAPAPSAIATREGAVPLPMAPAPAPAPPPPAAPATIAHELLRPLAPPVPVERARSGPVRDATGSQEREAAPATPVPVADTTASVRELASRANPARARGRGHGGGDAADPKTPLPAAPAQDPAAPANVAMVPRDTARPDGAMAGTAVVGAPLANAGVAGLERVMAAHEAGAARPAGHLMLRFEGADGAEGRVRLALRGAALHATIVAPDASLGERMRAGLDQLRDALETRGIGEARLSVVVPNDAPAGGAATGREDGRDPGRSERDGRSERNERNERNDDARRQSPRERGRHPQQHPGREGR